MATSRSYTAPIFRSLLSQSPAHIKYTPLQQVRNAVQSANAAKYKRKDASAVKKKKKGNSSFTNHDLKDAEQFALCDAMRYISPFSPAFV